jgi:hypothetical protein
MEHHMFVAIADSHPDCRSSSSRLSRYSHAAGRCAFAFLDLVRLSAVVERLQRSRVPPIGT